MARDDHDESERDRARAALARSESRFRAVTESMSDGLLALDARGNIIYANPAVKRIVGYAPDERIGRGMLEFIHADDVARVRETFAALLTGAPTARIDALRVRAKDGSWRVVDGTAARLPPSSDDDAVVITYRDVTEEHAMRDEFARSERRFRALTEKSAASVLIVGEDETIRYANAFVSLLDIPMQERIGLSIFARVHPDDVAQARELWADVVSVDGRVRRGDIRLKHRDGTWRWHDATWTNLLNDPAVGGVVVNHLDVTERIAAEEHLRSGHHLEAVGRLAAGVAHDFNNLLVGILGNASLLAANLSDPQHLESIEQIRVAGERAADLTKQILAFSRRQVLHRQAVDVNELLQGLVKLLRRLIRADVEMALVTGDGVGTVFADPGQLERVLVNLAVNAGDAMPEGGKLTIETSTVELAVDPADPASVAGRHVAIRVVDTGVGMAPEFVRHVFEPFFTTKELGRGTGLGLATVHGVVHQHGGRIAVESAPGRGSTFTVFLPSSTDAAAPKPRAIPRLAPSAAGDELVLVADDDEVARRITVRLLEGAGYRVLVAESGLEAVALFSEHKDEIALVLLDVVMPGLGGPAALARMEKIRSGVRFLFASGYAFDDHELDEHLAHRSLQKPFDLNTLLRRVRDVLDELPPPSK